MNLRTLLVGYLATFTIFFGRFPGAMAAGPTLVIDEVGWAGSSLNSSDEYLELVNLSDAPIDLSGFVLEGAATGGGALALPSVALASGDTFLITNFPATDTRSAVLAEADMVTSAISLSNTALAVILRAPDGSIVDQAGNGHAPLAGSSSPVTSMIRLDATFDGSDAGSWRAANASTGLKPGVSDLGTPGTADLEPVAPEAIEPPEPAPEEPEVPIEDAVEEPLAEPPEVSDPEPILDEPAEVVEEPEPVTEEPVLPIEDVPVVEDVPVEESETIVEPVTIPAASVAIVYPIGTLVINELMSDPTTGAEEFVEILNPYNNVIPLAGWTLKDGSGKRTALPDQLLGFGQLVLLSPIAGNLNNGSEALDLLDPTGVVIDHLSYGTTDVPAPKKSEALARDANGLFHRTTTITPREANMITEPVVAVSTKPKTSSVQTESTTKSVAAAPAKQVKASEKPTNPVEPTIVPPAALEPVPLTLRLSEIYAYTTGSDATDEFIELENVGDVHVPLAEWNLTDASGKSFTVKESLTLAPHARISFDRAMTHITLNNDADTIILTAPDGTEVDRHTYAKSKKGLSSALVADAWSDGAEPTPDEPNVIAEIVSVITTPKKSVAKSSVSMAVTSTTIEQALEKKDKTMVRVEGVVTALPATLGKQYVSIEDESGGVLLYKQDGAFPPLALGDRITVTGALSTSRGERRILINAKAIITPVSTGESVEPAAYSAELTAGTTVSMAGLIIREGGASMLRTDVGSIAIRLPEGVPAPQTGAKVEVVGVVRQLTDGQRVDVASATVLEPPDTSRSEPAAAAPVPRSRAGLALIAMALTALVGFFLKQKLAPIISRYVQPTPLRPSLETAD